MSRRVKLTRIIGDDEYEFSDLLGEVGLLQLHETERAVELNWFNPDNGSDLLCMARKRVVEHGDEIRVSTVLGNTFIFKEIKD